MYPIVREETWYTQRQPYVILHLITYFIQNANAEFPEIKIFISN